MKKYLIYSIVAFVVLLPLVGCFAQVRPDGFPVEASPNDGNFEVYSQKNGVNKKATLAALRQYFAANIISQIYPPPLSNNLESSRNKIIDVQSDGSIWYVDWAGYGIRLNTGIPLISEIATLSDTTNITNPASGDFAIAGNDLLIRGVSQWYIFTGADGNGIYNGSGNVPNNTVATVPSYGNFELSSDAARVQLQGDLVNVTSGTTSNQWGMQVVPGTFIQGDISGNGARIEMDANNISAEGNKFQVQSRAGNVGFVADSNSVFFPDLLNADVLGTDALGKMVAKSIDATEVSATPFSDITSINIQGQLEEVYSRIPGVLDAGSVLFVSQGAGDNNTGKVGNIVYPFADPWAARDTAEIRNIANPVIIVMDGLFTWGYLFGATKVTSDIRDISLARTNYTYYSFSGVEYRSLSYPGFPWGLLTISERDNHSVSNCKFLGESYLNLNITGASMGAFSDENGSIEIAFDKVRSNVNGGATVLAIQGKKNYEINGSKGGFADLDLRVRKLEQLSGRLIGFYGDFTNGDTLRNVALNIAIDEVEGHFFLHTFDPIAFDNFNFNAHVGVLRLTSATTSYWGNLSRAGMLNSDLKFSIGRMTGSSGTFSIERGDSHSSSIPSLNTNISYVIEDYVGNIYFRPRGYKTGSEINLFMSLSGVQTHGTRIVDILSTSYPNISYEFQFNIRKSPAALVECTNVNSPITISNSYYNGTGRALGVTSGGRTAPITIINSYLGSTTPSVITSNSVPINVAGAYLDISELGDKNVIRENSVLEPIWNQETFTTTAAQTTHTISTNSLPNESANLIVVIDGLEKTEGAAEYYTYVAATGVITFNAAFVGGEKVKIRYYD